MLKKILVPLDGSELAERALLYATALARATAAEILLVRVASSHTLVGVDGRDRNRAPFKRRRGTSTRSPNVFGSVASLVRRWCRTVMPPTV